MNPKTYAADVSAQDKEWEDHLTWMLENHPQRVLALFEKKKLRAYLDRKAALAIVKAGRLENEKKFPGWQAQEIVYHDLICPPDGPASRGRDPQPLTPKQQSAIEAWQESQEEPNFVEIIA